MRATVIPRGLHLKGEVVSEEDVRVAGEVHGRLAAPGREVLLEETAVVHAAVEARDLVVRGALRGDVRAAGKVELSATARVQGHVSAARLAAAEGASLVGSIRLHEPVPPDASAPAPSGEVRTSAALKALLDTLTPIPHAHLLDLGAVSQGSVDHLVGPGHELVFAELLPAARAAHAAGAPAEELLDERLASGAARFDAAFCWDVLAFAPAELLPGIVDRLHAAMRPGGVALAFFPASPAAAQAPPGRFEVLGHGLLRRRPSREAGEARFLTRRELERLVSHTFKTRDVLTQEGVHELLLFRRD